MKKIVLLLMLSSLNLFAGTGWYSDFIKMNKNGGAEFSYWIGADPSTGIGVSGQDLGAVKSLVITGTDMKYWCDGGGNRTGGAFYWQIKSFDGTSDITSASEEIWNHASIGGNDYQGTKTTNINVLNGLSPNTKYRIYFWAKSWGTSGGDSWLTNNGANYFVTFTYGLDGAGTEIDPYKIYTDEDLNLVRYYLGPANVGKYLKLMNDIDLTTYLASGAGYSAWGSSGWLPIGTNSSDQQFCAVFDGNNHKITGVKIDRTTDHIGFFALLGNGTSYSPQPTIKNLGVVIAADASVKSSGLNLGGLVGYQHRNTTISNCYVGGAVIRTTGAANPRVGGLAGYSFGTVENCYSTGTVTGYDNIGGLIGISDATIVACYSTSNVSGISSLGGLVGRGTGSITNCFARGSVTSTNNQAFVGGLVGGYETGFSTAVSNSYSTGLVVDTYTNFSGGLFGWAPSIAAISSFWDTQTSNRSGSGKNGEVGKTTAEMKLQGTFTDWDFTTIWAISPSINNGYPYLRALPSPLPVELTSFNASAAKNGVTLSWKTATETNNYGFEVERSSHPEQANDASTPLPKNGSVAQHDWVRIGFVEGNGTTNAPKSYSFVDNSASGKTSYRLKQIDRDGKFEYSQTVEVNAVSAPKEFALLQNHPNPFNPSTSIQYQIAAPGHVLLKVYDMVGREVATLVNGMQDAGVKNVQFDASHMPSGIYFYTLQTSSFTATKKMSLIK